jgi:UPF0755 protein
MDIKRWQRFFHQHIMWFALGVIVLGALVSCWQINLPNPDFPSAQKVVIKTGSTVTEISEQLLARGAIRSKFWFRLIMTGQTVKAGTYWFGEPLTTWVVAKRLAAGEFSERVIKVTLPEGVTVAEIGKILAAKLPGFSASKFTTLATKFEGQLFPDTYFFSPASSEDEIIEQLRQNFLRTVNKLSGDLANSDYPLNDIVIMASLLEEEARDLETRKMIAGILWKRIEAGQLLQVDAVFPYIMGKNSYNLSLADLKTDSLYNTYKYKGLPPRPISNPGLESLTAALEPTPSPYWFYLASREGVTYYAKDFEGHKLNRKKYLN